MNKENKDRMLKHIREGRYIPDTTFDVRLILDYKDMELYAKPCCERIAAAGLVDGIHVARDIQSPWNLNVDCRGLELCKEILGRYLQPEHIEEISAAMRWSHESDILCNNHIYTLKKMTVKKLKATQKELLTDKKEGNRELSDLLKAELESRGMLCKIRRLPERIGDTLRLLEMLRGPVRELPILTAAAWKEWIFNGSAYYEGPKGKHTDALRRFTDVHGGMDGAGKLEGGELARYIYLAVKAYGKENQAEYNHAGTVKSCLEIERRHHHLLQVMTAIGRLAPRKLLQMYPVTKEYAGEQMGWKDYFFTMGRLKKLPMDEPIGDAQDVACLLWDYQNWDLELLLLQWMNVLSDMEIYCNEPGVNDEFHKRLRQREGVVDGEK